MNATEDISQIKSQCAGVYEGNQMKTEPSIYYTSKQLIMGSGIIQNERMITDSH